MANASFACSVPVFRYALENWEPDQLTVAILHDGKLSDFQQALVDQIQKAADEADEVVNLQLHPIDVSAEHREGSAEAFHSKEWRGKELPHMLVYFSNDAPQPQQAWSAAFTKDNVQQLLSSPVRTEVVERLLGGQSAVWILLKSGNKADDERAERELKLELAKKPDEIELPSLTDLATEEKFDEELPVEMRVEFSVISIDPDDKQERFFREMLLSTEDDLKDFTDPIAIPIYGRGRTYFALVGPGITTDNITDNCNFICGACSCEVKRDNPGQDLLLAANWNRVEPGNWVNDTPLPELTGIGGFAAVVDDAATETSPVAEAKESEVNVPDNSGDSDVEPSSREIASSLQNKQAIVASNTTKTTSDRTDATESNTNVNTSATNSVAPILLLWGAVLFGAGLVFTVWQRKRNQE